MAQKSILIIIFSLIVLDKFNILLFNHILLTKLIILVMFNFGILYLFKKSAITNNIVIFSIIYLFVSWYWQVTWNMGLIFSTIYLFCDIKKC